MSLFFRFFISVIISLTSYVSISAAGFVDFALAPQVYLSGTSSDARFDVAGALFDSGSPIPAPHIVTGTRTFSGAFYLSGAGWVLMSTGSYHVDLDCGVQSLTGITANCTLSGTAWSETIGDIVFDRRVQYLTGGTLSGVVWTWIGDQSLSGIIVPLRRAEITDADYISVANHETQIDIIDPLIYTTSGGSWNIEFNPRGVIFPEASTNSSHIYDLSIASDYDLTITDPNGSQTRYEYAVDPDIPSMTLHADISTTRKYDACDPTPINITICPDGAVLTGSTIVVDRYSLIADTHDAANVTIKFRDQYGNLVDTGTVDIIYHTPIQLIQTTESPYYTLLSQESLDTPSYLGDALIFDSIFSTYNSLGNSYITGSTSLVGGDISYSFRSYAPGTISLESILYNGASTSLTHDPIVFDPWLSVDSIIGPTEIRIGTGAIFDTIIANNSSESNMLSPTLISGFSIGDGLFAAFTDFSGSLSSVCQANTTNPIFYTGKCSWTNIGSVFFPSILVQDIGTADATYTFSGNYTPLLPIAYVPPETVTGYSYISYEKDGKTVIYPSLIQTFGTSIFQNLRIRILGQKQADGWYNGLQVGTTSKTDFFNQIRKNVAILNRNRTDYANAQYIYTGSDFVVGFNGFNNGRRTIIVEGAEVNINRDIPLQSHPLTIIALKDTKTGTGGVIRILSGVTDIHATLIAEDSLRGTGSKQLYIHGSIISNNTLGGASKASRECPYFDNTSCGSVKAKKYDLEYLRDTYTNISSNWATGATAAKYRDTSLIIEYDPRILTDPPPGLDIEN